MHRSGRPCRETSAAAGPIRASWPLCATPLRARRRRSRTMEPEFDVQLGNELRQHEVGASLHSFDLERRDFLKLFGGGILICVCSASTPAQESGRVRGTHELPKDIAAWLRIAQDGHVTVFTGKVEVGQNIRTSLAQQVCEELRTAMESVTLVMGDTEQVPWDAGTFGSRTTPTMGPQLRTMAVAARYLLLNLAANAWQVDASTLVATESKIRDPKSGKSIGYGELTHGQKLVKVIAGDPPFTPASQWKVAGQPVPKGDGPDFVTGKHQYASALQRPGTLCGKVLRAGRELCGCRRARHLAGGKSNSSAPGRMEGSPSKFESGVVLLSQGQG